jgi:GNAT superfamily N-acetyltransferase
MFAEMGFPEDSLAAMDREALPYFLQAFADATYHHWFIDRGNGVQTGVAAGAGVSLNRFYPGPRDPRPQRAWILNVYTERDCRRQGMARKLVETAIDWCRHNGIRSVYLHASQYGMSLYESLGFVSSNEMRLDLGP